MRAFFFLILHILLIATVLLDFIGSSQTYTNLLIFQILVCLLVIFAFAYIFILETKPLLKVYESVLIGVAIICFVNGILRLFFQVRLFDFI